MAHTKKFLTTQFFYIIYKSLHKVSFEFLDGHLSPINIDGEGVSPLPRTAYIDRILFIEYGCYSIEEVHIWIRMKERDKKKYNNQIYLAFCHTHILLLLGYIFLKNQCYVNVYIYIFFLAIYVPISLNCQEFLKQKTFNLHYQAETYLRHFYYRWCFIIWYQMDNSFLYVLPILYGFTYIICNQTN